MSRSRRKCRRDCSDNSDEETVIYEYRECRDKPCYEEPGRSCAPIPGPYNQGTPPPNIYTTNATLIASDLLSKIFVSSNTLSSAITLTIPSAAFIVSAIPGAVIGTTLRVIFIATTGAINLAAGTGVNIYSPITIAAGTQRTVIIQITNISNGSQAVSVY